jgi:hypothetical protein
LISAAKDGCGTLQINAANLILVLQGKVYKDYACNSVVGTISVSALAELQNAVRNRILELTIELEKESPLVGEISIRSEVSDNTQMDRDRVTNITNQTIYGSYTSIMNNKTSGIITINIERGNINSFVKSLADAGITQDDASELASIVASERPGASSEYPFGKKAREWIKSNIGKALDGTWKIGIDIATKLITEAAIKYYGLN